ncbi:hypothetical protein [Methylobacterium tarhaniae]
MIGLHSLDGMSVEEFNEVVRAWNRAQDPEGKPELTDSEIDALSDWMGI